MTPYYPLSPVEQVCVACHGVGLVLDRVCAACDGVGRTFIEGAPGFGCRMTLEDAVPGQIVTLGNGDRGRVVQCCRRGTHTVEIALIDPMFDSESPTTTTYPSAVGVISMAVGVVSRKSKGSRAGRGDHMDPLQKRKAI